MELNDLIEEIRKDQKMSMDELVSMLADAVENEQDCSWTYKVIYKKAYGDHLTPATCKAWVKKMEVTDGSARTTGEKWTVDQTTDIGQRMGVNWNQMTKYEFNAAMNAAYSDMYRTANKYQIQDDPEFFADMVLDYFLYDTDAKNKSVFCYYFEHVA